MSWKVAPLSVKVDDTPEGSQVARGAELERKPKGGPRAKEGRDSIGQK